MNTLKQRILAAVADPSLITNELIHEAKGGCFHRAQDYLHNWRLIGEELKKAAVQRRSIQVWANNEGSEWWSDSNTEIISSTTWERAFWAARLAQIAEEMK